MFSKKTEKKSISHYVGMLDSFLAMTGKGSTKELIAEYQPKFIQEAKAFEERIGQGNSIMLNIMLSPAKTNLVASIYTITPEGVASLESSYPIEDILKIVDQILETENENDNLSATAEQLDTEIRTLEEGNTSLRTGTTIAEPNRTEAGTPETNNAGDGGTTTDAQDGGVPQQANGDGAQAIPGDGEPGDGPTGN